MPYMVGQTIGGPGVGAAAAAGTMAAGSMGRKAATSMQQKNAEIASALMRGGNIPKGISGNTAAKLTPSLIAALLGERGPKR